MKKTFTLAAAAFMALSAMAADPGVTADPASGSTVESLSTISLTTNSSTYDQILLEGRNIFYLTDEYGEDVEGYTFSYTGENPCVIAVTPPIDIPGTYVLSIANYGIMYGNSSNEDDVIEAENEISLYWHVSGSNPGPQTGINWTPDPTPGSVESLSQVKFSFDPDEIFDIDVNQIDDIKVLKNGSEFCGVSWQKNAYDGVFTLETPATEEGTYVLNIPAGAMTFWTPGYDDSYDNPDLSYEYVIGGGSSSADYGLKWTPNPLPGPVETLSTIVFSYASSDYGSISEEEKYPIQVLKDGQPFSTVKISHDTDADPCTYTVKLKTQATEDGAYTLVFPAGELCVFNSDGTWFNNDKDLTYTWTIGESAEFFYTTDPAGGATLQAPLSTVKFSFGNCLEASISEDLASGITVSKDNLPVATTVSAVNDRTAKTATLTFSPALDEAGSYALHFPENILTYFIKDYSDLHYVNDLELSFTLTPAPVPVVYDMECTSTRPAQGATLDLANEQLDALFFNVPAETRPAADAKITIANEDGSYSHEVDLKFSYETRFWAQIPGIQKEGKYTVTVPQGVFGDPNWQANHEYGHANKAFTVTFDVLNYKVEQDIEPVSITPAEGSLDKSAADLAVIKITFPAGTKANPDARATLSCAAADYSQRTVMTATAEEGVFTLTFDPAPHAAGEYTLEIPAGCVGDQMFIDTKEGNGHCNPANTYTWTVTAGIEVIDAEGAATYYNMQGVRVANPRPGQMLIKVEQGKAAKVVR